MDNDIVVYCDSPDRYQINTNSHAAWAVTSYMDHSCGYTVYVCKRHDMVGMELARGLTSDEARAMVRAYAEAMSHE